MGALHLQGNAVFGQDLLVLVHQNGFEGGRAQIKSDDCHLCRPAGDPVRPF
jgi:hypothetical protein